MFIKENELKCTCARQWRSKSGVLFKGITTVLRQIFYKAAFVKGELNYFK